MTNFIYNMQDELFNLPLEDFSTIKKLVDHIEAQGKQLRELNAAITKRNTTIEKYEREKKDLQERNSYLIKKVDELNNGIRNSEDLTWKQKYEALLHSSEQAIGALQKKCQEYKNAESDATANTIADLVKENKELKEEVNLYIGVTNTKNEEIEALAKAVRCPWGNNAEIISAKTARIKELEEKNKTLEDNFEKLKHRRNELIARGNELSAENKKLEAEKKIADDRWWEAEKELTSMKLANKKLEGGTIEHLEKRCREAEKDLEDEKQVSKDLNAIINSKNKLLDEYMTKANNLESELMDYIKENSNLRAKIARIGGMCDGIKKIVKE